MAKPLVFQFHDRQIGFEMSKVDRSKLYGFKETEVVDDAGQKCELATLSHDGRTLIGRGGTGLGYITADGAWIEKSQLKPVDSAGDEVQPVPSSFSAPVPLAEQTTVDDYLDHLIRAVYVMQTADAADDLLEELKQGAIYRFPYSYRGGLEADVGFLLTNGDGDLFMAVGKPTKVEYLGLQQAAAAVSDEEEAEEDGDDLDFSMM